MTERTKKPTGVTLHLTPEPVWLAHERAAHYRPEGFAREGFIHCTDGEALVIEVGNRYYRDDPQPYVVLDVDPSRVGASVVYEDQSRHFPHVYGPIEREAVSRVRRVERGPNGTFLRIGGPFDAGTS